MSFEIMESEGSPVTAASDFVWLDTETALATFCNEAIARIRAGEFTAVYLDTEADSLHHFQEKLCLIQLAAGGRFALIDPLAITDMSPLLALLDQADLWLHGADYDLTLLKRTYGWTPKKLHDTQVASRLTGHRAFGLAALVAHYCQVTLCKSSQKADWSQRPLPAKMQAYAVDDVRYLETLVQALMADLAAKGRLAWFEQSCESLREDVINRRERDREDAWRISGSGRFRPKGLVLVREIWLWREQMAKERDVPPFRILNNQQILAMAMEWEAQGTVSIPPKWKGRWRSSLVELIEHVRQSDPTTWPQRIKSQHFRATDEQRAAVENLCRFRDSQAASLDLESSLLGSRAVLEDIVLRRSEEDELMTWQRDLLDDGLKAALSASASSPTT